MDYPIKDIPQNLMDEVCNQLMCYSVPILGLSPEKPGPNLKLLGSGTLVEFEGKHNILTAAHVWHATEGAQEIGSILTEHPRSSFVRMRRDSIAVRCLWGGNNSAWGPDLALLELSYPDVSIIAAHKSFVNLSRQRAMLASRPPNIEKGLWAVIGTVGELSSIHFSQQEQIETAAVHERAFFSLVQDSYQNNGYDFLDLRKDGSSRCTVKFLWSKWRRDMGGWRINRRVRKNIMGRKATIPRCTNRANKSI